MQQKDLAAALDISPSMVCRLAKRGMPTDDVERAQRWRRRHLEAGRVKGVRFEAPPRKPPAPAQPAADDTPDLDMADAIDCLAIIATQRGAGTTLPALRHLVPLLSDRQLDRVLDGGYINTHLWGLIEAPSSECTPTPSP